MSESETKHPPIGTIQVIRRLHQTTEALVMLADLIDFQTRPGNENEVSSVNRISLPNVAGRIREIIRNAEPGIETAPADSGHAEEREKAKAADQDRYYKDTGDSLTSASPFNAGWSDGYDNGYDAGRASLEAAVQTPAPALTALEVEAWRAWALYWAQGVHDERLYRDAQNRVRAAVAGRKP